MKLKLILLNLILIAALIFAVTPTISQFYINGNEVYTINTLLTLTMASDASQMSFSCNNSAFTSDESFATSKQFDLSNQSAVGCTTSDGTKTVYFKAISSDGNTATTSDTIILDRTAPSISQTNPSTGSYTNDQRKVITAQITDSTSGVDSNSIKINVKGTDYYVSSSQVTYTPDSNYGEGAVAVTIDAKDNAGNSAAQTSFSFTVDVTAPSKVTIFSVSNLGTGSSARLTYSPVGTGNSYKIYRSTSTITNLSSSALTLLTTITDTIYDATGLTTGTTYYFAVGVSDAAGNMDNNVTGLDKNVTISDSTAPGAASDPVVSSRCNAQVSLSWNKNSESDLSSYLIYRDFDSTVDFNGQTNIWTLNNPSCTPSCTITDANNLVNDVNYFYKIKAVDTSGNIGPANNNATPATPIACTGPSPPSVSSSSHASQGTWYSNNDISLSWGAVSGATGYSYVLDSSAGTNPSDAMVSGTSTSFSDKSNGIHYFHIKAFNGSVWGTATHFEIKIDTQGPSAPGSFTLSDEGEGDIALDWSSSSDSLSGIEKYYIYRGTSSNVSTSSGNEIASTTNTDYSDSVSSSNTYYYKVLAKDNAGNIGDPSSEKSIEVEVQDTSGCSIAISSSLSGSIGLGKKTITISSSNGDMKNTDIKLKTFGEAYANQATSFDGDEKSFDYTFTADHEGEGKIFVLGEDEEGDSCSKTFTFTVDAGAPTVAWLAPENNSKGKGNIKLEVEAIDGTGIERITFYYNETKISSVSSGTNNKYSLTWVTADVKAGTYNLKAIARDSSGNESEKTIKFILEKDGASISNTGTETISSDRKEKEISNNAYEFDPKNTVFLYQNTGLTSSLLEEAMKKLENNNFGRELKVLEVTDNNKTFFKASVKLVIENDSNSEESIQLIEVIPKEFAEKASQIISTQSFEVIEEDPIIKFTFTGIKAGETRTVSYELKENLTKEEADKLIDNKVVSKFKSPPILLDEATKVGKENFTVKGIDSNYFLLGGALIFVILIVLIVGGGIFYYYSQTIERNSSDYIKDIEERTKPKRSMKKRESREEENFVDIIQDIFRPKRKGKGFLK